MFLALEESRYQEYHMRNNDFVALERPTYQECHLQKNIFLLWEKQDIKITMEKGVSAIENSTHKN